MGPCSDEMCCVLMICTIKNIYLKNPLSLVIFLVSCCSCSVSNVDETALKGYFSVML